MPNRPLRQVDRTACNSARVSQVYLFQRTTKMTDDIEADGLQPSADAAFNKRMSSKVVMQSYKFASTLHVALVSHVAHAYEHGDPVFINRTFNGLSKGFRREAIRKWLMKDKLFKVTSKKGEDGASEFIFAVVPEVRKALVDSGLTVNDLMANLMPIKFWEYGGEEKIYTGFDLTKRLKALASALDLAERGKKKVDGVEIDLTAEEKAKIDLTNAPEFKRCLKHMSGVLSSKAEKTSAVEVVLQ